jgi:uncharacterized protein (TIGR03435 family)
MGDHPEGILKAMPGTDRWPRHRIGFSLFLGLILSAHGASYAQTNTTSRTPPGNLLSYDVVSVKPARPGPGTLSWWQTTKDGFSAITTVQTLIQNAYGLITEDQILNLPGWAKSEPFAVAGKMDPDTFAAYQNLSAPEREQQSHRMLQSILVDRFGMRARNEIRQLPAYALVIAKDGPRLKQTTGDQGPAWSSGRDRIHGQGIEMSTLAANLSGQLGRIVVNKTRLPGKYDVDLKWTPDDETASGDSAPSLLTALQEQLGLKLSFGKAPVECLVVERIAKPSEN